MGVVQPVSANDANIPKLAPLTTIPDLVTSVHICYVIIEWLQRTIAVIHPVHQWRLPWMKLLNSPMNTLAHVEKE